ncbi:MAG TPA: hypothetical protein VLA04_01450 [Verrucomicrobiae bacterium]|nr:hypothetical protein [Verrucomicrobiae bacterium]
MPTIQAGSAILATFLSGYLPDKGVGLAFIEAVARNLFALPPVDGESKLDPKAIEVAQELTGTAFGDVMQVSGFGGVGEFNLDRVIDGAPSLDMLVRNAKLVDERIIPRDVIPSDELVSACLAEFHARKQGSATPEA